MRERPSYIPKDFYDHVVSDLEWLEYRVNSNYWSLDQTACRMVELDRFSYFKNLIDNSLQLKNFLYRKCF